MKGEGGEASGAWIGTHLAVTGGNRTAARAVGLGCSYSWNSFPNEWLQRFAEGGRHAPWGLLDALSLLVLTLWRMPCQQWRGSGVLVLRTSNLSQQVASKVNGGTRRVQHISSLHGCSASRLSGTCWSQRIGRFRSKLQASHIASQFPL